MPAALPSRTASTRPPPARTQDGELLCSSNAHNCALRMVEWVPASSADPASRGGDSPYLCSIVDLFSPLPSLPKGNGAQQMLDSAPLQLDLPLHKLLFEPERSLFDIALSVRARG